MSAETKTTPGGDHPELSLGDIVAAFRARWILVAAALAASIVASVIYLTVTVKIYEVGALLRLNSEALGQSRSSAGSSGLNSLLNFAGGGLAGGSERIYAALDRLRSRQFLSLVISKKNYLPQLYPEIWDQEKNRWQAGSGAPRMWDAVERLRDVIDYTLDPRSNLVTISIRWPAPKVAAVWLEDLIAEINAVSKIERIERSERNIQYLQQRFEKTRIEETRGALIGLISAELKNAMLAEGVKDYVFETIDPPQAPPEGYHVSPRRGRVLVLAAVIGLLLPLAGIFAALLVSRSGLPNRTENG